MFLGLVVGRYLWLFMRYAIALILFVLIFSSVSQVLAMAFLFIVFRLEEIDFYCSAVVDRLEEMVSIYVAENTIKEEE